MADDISDIQAFYNGSCDGEDSRLIRHQLERDMTLRYLERHLPASASVLEVGAATGFYALWLARRGHRVTAVDLAQTLVERCRQRVAEAGLAERVDCHVADARDLWALPRRTYDAALLMGPLYHLILHEDRLRALRQCCERLRPGGILFSAHISRFGILGDLLRTIPQWIEDQQEVRSFLDRGRRPDESPKGGFRGHFVTVDEVVPLHEEAGMETIVLAGVEPAISADDESYNRLEGKQRELWSDLLFELSSEPSLVASSRHLLYIGRKPQ